VRKEPSHAIFKRAALAPAADDDDGLFVIVFLV
jgi:hypothetical protein